MQVSLVYSSEECDEVPLISVVECSNIDVEHLMLPGSLVIGVAVDPKQVTTIHRLCNPKKYLSSELELQRNRLFQQPVLIGVFS